MLPSESTTWGEMRWSAPSFDRKQAEFGGHLEVLDPICAQTVKTGENPLTTFSITQLVCETRGVAGSQNEVWKRRTSQQKPSQANLTLAASNYRQLLGLQPTGHSKPVAATPKTRRVAALVQALRREPAQVQDNARLVRADAAETRVGVVARGPDGEPRPGVPDDSQGLDNILGAPQVHIGGGRNAASDGPAADWYTTSEEPGTGGGNGRTSSGIRRSHSWHPPRRPRDREIVSGTARTRQLRAQPNSRWSWSWLLSDLVARQDWGWAVQTSWGQQIGKDLIEQARDTRGGPGAMGPGLTLPCMHGGCISYGPSPEWQLGGQHGLHFGGPASAHYAAETIPTDTFLVDLATRGPAKSREVPLWCLYHDPCTEWRYVCQNSKPSKSENYV